LFQEVDVSEYYTTVNGFSKPTSNLSTELSRDDNLIIV